MASLLEKARTIVLSTAHSVLDRVIDLNNIGAVRQYVRDVEEARDDTREARAVAKGNRDTTVQERDALKAKVDELQGNIDFIIGDDDDANDRLALPLQARLEGQKSQLEIQERLVITAEDLYAKLTEAETTLSAKYEAMRSRLGELEAMDKATAAQNSAAKSLHQAAGVLSDGTAGDIDDVAAKIRREHNISNARLDQAMEGVDGGIEKDLNLVKAQQALALRKQQLKAAKEAASGGVPASA